MEIKMKKPKIIINTDKSMPKESIEELLQYKKAGTLNEYFENGYIFENERKKINVGNIILFNFLNAELYCKITLVADTENIFTHKKKQIVNFTYEDITIT